MENTERKSVAQLAKVAAPQRDFAAPSLADAQAGSKREAEFQAERMNSDLTHRYLLNFGGWKTEVLAGKRDNKTPPQPPKAWVAAMQDDGFWYEVPGTEPVCAMPFPLQEDYSKTQTEVDAETGANNIDIGVNIGGNYWSAGPKDTCKAGFRTPPMPPGKDYPGGSVFEKVGFFMGKGWWLRQ